MPHPPTDQELIDILDLLPGSYPDSDNGGWASVVSSWCASRRRPIGAEQRDHVVALHEHRLEQDEVLRSLFRAMPLPGPLDCTPPSVLAEDLGQWCTSMGAHFSPEALDRAVARRLAREKPFSEWPRPATHAQWKEGQRHWCARHRARRLATKISLVIAMGMMALLPLTLVLGTAGLALGFSSSLKLMTGISLFLLFYLWIASVWFGTFTNAVLRWAPVPRACRSWFVSPRMRECEGMSRPLDREEGCRIKVCDWLNNERARRALAALSLWEVPILEWDAEHLDAYVHGRRPPSEHT